MIQSDPPSDPTGGEAAQGAIKTATTGGRISNGDIESQIAMMGVTGATYVRVGKLYHIAIATEVGHRYISPPLERKELLVWLGGWITCKNLTAAARDRMAQEQAQDDPGPKKDPEPESQPE